MTTNKDINLKEIDKLELDAILGFLTTTERDELYAYLDVRNWAAGEIVMKDGESGDFMGFLMKGKLAVKKETAFAGKYILVAILDEGAMVGEASAFGAGKRTATVEAMEDCQLLILSKKSMDKLFQTKRELAVKILKRILYVLNMRLQNADDRLAWLL